MSKSGTGFETSRELIFRKPNAMPKDGARPKLSEMVINFQIILTLGKKGADPVEFRLVLRYVGLKIRARKFVP